MSAAVRVCPRCGIGARAVAGDACARCSAPLCTPEVLGGVLRLFRAADLCGAPVAGHLELLLDLVDGDGRIPPGWRAGERAAARAALSAGGAIDAVEVAEDLVTLPASLRLLAGECHNGHAGRGHGLLEAAVALEVLLERIGAEVPS